MTRAVESRPDSPSTPAPPSSGRFRTGRGPGGPAEVGQLLGRGLPLFALVVLFVVCAVLQPGVLTLSGLALLLSPAVPLVLASVSQMVIITLGDIDLGNGALVGLVTAVVAVYLVDRPLLAVALLVGIGALYVGQALLVQLRGIPSIIVTLGASFVWLGTGLALLPIPGGTVPAWLSGLMNLTTPETENYVLPVPMAVVFAAAIGLLAWFLLIRLPYGAVIRAVGSNPAAVRRGGWSVLRARMAGYAIAAGFAILAGIALAGQISAGDATTTANYTLLAVAAVILGGGQFSGGRAVPFGAVFGAFAISLVASMLSFLDVPSSYQSAVQGLVLVLVLAGRVLTDRGAT
ncbi:MAG TPA: ABC transporter permease [Pseudonocardia sp.]